MLKHRLLTSAIGVPFTIYVVYLGGYYFFLSIFLVVMVATYEFYKISKAKNIEYSLAFSLLLNASILVLTFFGKKGSILPLLVFFIIFSSIYKALFQDNIDKLLEEIGLEIFSSLYVAFFLSYFLLLRRLPKGAELVIFLLGVCWLNDSFAYFIGKKWGKVKINTHISPNKTREGAIGGFIGGILTGITFGYFFHFSLLYAFALSIIIVLVSQIGDLIESAFKREVGVKDAGTIIPGHGGILDRFDGLIYATPIFYYLITLVFKNLGG